MIRHNPQDATQAAKDTVRVVVGTDNSTLGEKIRDLLVHNEVVPAAPLVASLASVVDRASHAKPSLAVIVLPDDPADAYAQMRELSQRFPLKILAIGPSSDPQMILRTLDEGGADEYLDVSCLGEELTGALSRYRPNEPASETEQAGPLISVIGASGGCGASTVAVNVSAAVASQHGTCGLVDLRLCNGDLAALLDLEPRYGIAELCSNLARLDRSMLQQFFVTHKSGVRLLAAPTSFANRELVSVEGVRQAITMARTEFPCLVVDLDNVLADEQKEALWQSDAALLVLRLDYTSLRNVRRTMEQLRYMGVRSDKIKVVANRTGQRNQLSVGEAEEALGVRLLEKIPDEPARVNAAVNAGVPVVLQCPRARVSRQLAALAKRLTHPGDKS